MNTLLDRVLFEPSAGAEVFWDAASGEVFVTAPHSCHDPLTL